MKPSERIEQLKDELLAYYRKIEPHTPYPIGIRESAIIAYLDEQQELRAHASEGAIAKAEEFKKEHDDVPYGYEVKAWTRSGDRVIGLKKREPPDTLPPGPCEPEPCNCEQSQRLARELADLKGRLRAVDPPEGFEGTACGELTDGAIAEPRTASVFFKAARRAAGRKA